MECRTVYLLDGSSFVYRSFFALPKLTTKDGFPTSAIYGFLRGILSIIKSENPECFLVAFDLPAPTKREKVYKEYKINRPKMPDPLKVQIPVIKEMLRLMGIPVAEKEGYEADDIIGFLALKFAKEGRTVKVYTPDKDMLQLVDDRIIVINPMNGEVFNKKKVLEKFGVEPSHIPDYLALVGDKVDNIEGVKGVGPKKAIEIINKYGSVKEILEHRWDEFKREFPQADKESLKIYYELVRLHVEVGEELDNIDTRIKEADWDKLEKRIKELEMKSLLKDIELLKKRRRQATLF